VGGILPVFAANVGRQILAPGNVLQRVDFPWSWLGGVPLVSPDKRFMAAFICLISIKCSYLKQQVSC
jgi:hypothetical protein